jgi:uncharacterized protein (TIGR02271 family)
MATPKQRDPTGRRQRGEGELDAARPEDVSARPEMVTEPSWAGGPQVERATREAATGSGTAPDRPLVAAEDERTLELREEQLVAHKELRELGEVEVRTEIDEVPGRLEVDALREEVEVEHEPVGQVVSRREEPWEQDGTLVVPVYEEQLVVSKRLVLRERLRIRRVRTTERQLFQDTLRRERLVVEDPDHTGLVHEVYATDAPAGEEPADQGAGADQAAPAGEQPEGGFLEHLVRKALE